MSFHVTITPASGANFPLPIVVYLQQQGAIVAGTTVSHTFHTTADIANMSFTQIIQVTTAPTTLKVIGSGGTYLYYDNAITIYKIGDVS